MHHRPRQIEVMRELRHPIQALREVVVITMHKDHRFAVMRGKIGSKIAAKRRATGVNLCGGGQKVPFRIGFSHPRRPVDLTQFALRRDRDVKARKTHRL